MAKSKKVEELEQKVAELTADVQRTRADFENYRKRVDLEKQAAQQTGQTKAILKLLPVLDTIERAAANIPDDIAEHTWAKGVAAMAKKLQKMTDDLGLERIKITPEKTAFDPTRHNAISMEDGQGERQVVVEELQAGYLLDGQPVREAMVRVAHRP